MNPDLQTTYPSREDKPVPSDVSANDMTLRDYFAAHIMAGTPMTQDFSPQRVQTRAVRAYKQADAMLEARKHAYDEA